MIRFALALALTFAFFVSPTVQAEPVGPIETIHSMLASALEAISEAVSETIEEAKENDEAQSFDGPPECEPECAEAQPGADPFG